MSKHNPAPWKLIRWKETGLPRAIVHGPRNSVICDFDDIHPIDLEAFLANAMVMSASPEMLDALKNFPGFLADQKAQDAWLAGVVALIEKSSQFKE